MKSVVAIVIPAYNEERHIKQVIRSISRSVSIGKLKFEVVIVVVDDYSSDRTASVALESGAVVVRHAVNSGAGAATRTGLRYAEIEVKNLAYVITIDADGQHSSHDIESMLTFAVEKNASMVVGSRLHPGNRDTMPLHRLYGNMGLSLISRILFGITTKDTQSGLRLIRADIVSKVSKYTIDRYGFCTEMLWLAKREHVEVLEVPISVSYSKDTLEKGQNNWGVISLVIDLIWIRISRQ